MKRLENAVLDNMLTTRFRNWRPVLLITLYNLLLIGAIFIMTGFSSMVSGYIDANTTGTMMFYVLVIFQFGLIIMIMPAITAGLISGERERKTLDLLLCTQMTPMGIVFGKLLSGCMFMGLCVVCSLPMVTMAYLFGGVSALSILSILACYLVTIIAVGSLGVFFSSLFKRTTAAVVVSYLAMFIIGIASTLGGYADLTIQSYMHQGVQNFIPHYSYFWIVNPFISLVEILGRGAGYSSSFLGTLVSLAGQGQWPTMWYWELLTLVVISVALILLSARILSPRKGWRAWKEGGHAGRPVK